MTALITATGREYRDNHPITYPPPQPPRAEISTWPHPPFPASLGKLLPAQPAWVEISTYPPPPPRAGFGGNIYLTPSSLSIQLGQKFLPVPSPANKDREIYLSFPQPTWAEKSTCPSPQPAWAEISTCSLPSQHDQRYLPVPSPANMGRYIYLPPPPPPPASLGRNIYLPPPQPTWAEISSCLLRSQLWQKYLPSPSPANMGRDIYLPPPQPAWAEISTCPLPI